MASEWLDHTLGDVLTLQRGFDLPETDRQPGSFPVIASTGRVGTHSKAMVKGPGVVIGRSGSLGGGQFIRADFWPLNTTLWVKDYKGNDVRFCYYLLKSLDLATFNAGSGVPTLNRNHIHPIPVRVPAGVAEQRAIAHILGTLDDKIELNRRMNETLEAMARALFKSWFVDFLPLRAKMAARTQTGDPVRLPAEGSAQAGAKRALSKVEGAEGRPSTTSGQAFSGLSKHLADLFPDSFEDSELGKIPKGWSVSSLGDIVRPRVERCTRSAETAAMPYVPIDCISSKSLFLTESKSGEEAQSSLTRFYKGDILFGAMRPYFHKVCVAPFNGTTRTTAFVLFPANKDDFSYATLLLHDPETIDYATRQSTGSTIPYAVWSGALAGMRVILPPVAVRAKFDHIVRPILERIPARYFENGTLAALRDTLLPKLISGELRIRDAERIIGRHV